VSGDIGGAGPPVALLVRLAWQGFVRSGPRAALTVAIGAVAALILLVGMLVYPAAQAQVDRQTRLLDVKSGLVYRPGRAGLLLESRKDHYRDARVSLTAVAAVGGTSLRPVGVSSLPAPREMVVSPALAQLLGADPVLRQRYPGRVVGLIGEPGLIGPRDLRLYQGARAELLVRRHALLTLAFQDPSGGGADESLPVPGEVRAGVPFTVIAFLVPLLGLFALVATMGSAPRSRRVAALRLLGMTSRQVRAMFAGEAAVTAAVSFLMALVLVVVLRGPLAPHAPVSDGAWPGDVSLPTAAVLAAALALPALAGCSAWLSLRRSASHPVEVARQAPGHRVRRRRVALLVVGAVLVGAAEPARHLFSLDASVVTLGIGCVLIIAGLIRASSLLSLRAAQLLWRVTGRLDSLIASRRIMAQPTETAKVAAGVSLLVFVAGLLLSFFPLLSESTADEARALTALVGRDTFTAEVSSQAAAARLRQTPGVRAVAEFVPGKLPSGKHGTYVDCAGTAVLLRISVATCMHGLPRHAAGVLNDAQVLGYGSSLFTVAAIPDKVWRASGAHRVLVATAQSADPEKVRTAIIAVSDSPEVLTAAESQADRELNTKTFRDITLTALILASLVAIASLAAALVEQIQLQQRSYAMLNVTGVSRRTLTSALLRQTTVSVAPTAVVAWGLGMVATTVFLRLNDTSTLTLPLAASLWVLLAALLIPVAACLAVTSTLRTALAARLE